MSLIDPRPPIFIRKHQQSGSRMCGDDGDFVGLALNLSTGHSVRRRVGRTVQDVRPRFGMVNIIPPTVTNDIEVTGTSSVVLVGVRWSTLAEAIHETHDVDVDRVEVLTRHHAEDPELTQLIVTAASHGPAATAAAAPLLARLLLRNHSNRPEKEPTFRSGGLAPAKVRRILDHIEAHLETPLLLHELAAAANLSLFHFAREFHRAVGMPPRTYILQRRVYRALELIASEACTSSDAATSVGFVDTSHLARQLRQQFGVNIREFRRGLLPPL